jgi:rhamnosyl/mannosyltransferase
MGVDTRIFTLSPSPVPAKLELPEGEVTRARSWAAPASCDIGGLDALQQFRQLADWADVLHFHFPWPFADLLYWMGGRSKPAVMTYHSDIVRQKWLGQVYGPLMRKTLKAMSAVVATSNAYARTSPILNEVVTADRLRAIPLGILDFRGNGENAGLDREIANRIVPGAEPYFLALGVLRYYKGFDTLIRAARNVRAKIVIAGSGPQDCELRMLAAQEQADNVVFAGQVSEQEKFALLNGCQGLVLPSHLRSEAFGMVLVEASMLGKPMVCCEIGTGTSYVNEHGVTGFVVEPGQPQMLADAMNRLASDEPLRTAMGLAARRRYDRLFSGEALGRAYSELYREVAAT